MRGSEPKDGRTDGQSFTGSYGGLARSELKAGTASILVEHGVTVKDGGWIMA